MHALPEDIIYTYLVAVSVNDPWTHYFIVVNSFCSNDTSINTKYILFVYSINFWLREIPLGALMLRK